MATLAQQGVSEFIGTFVLVLTVCCELMAGSALASMGIACSLMVGIYSLGDVSGANFNPAVSGGLWLSGKLGHAGLKDFTITKCAVFKLVQCLAAVCAACCTGLLYGYTFITPLNTSASNVIDQNGAFYNVNELTQTHILSSPPTFPVLGAENSYGMISKMLAEAFYTCMLVFTVLSTATNPTSNEKGNHYFGLAIGFVIMAGANAIGHVSGCSLNPAVSLGLTVGSMMYGSVTDYGVAILKLFLYSLAQTIGMLLAVGLFHVVRSANIKKRTDSKEGTRDESMLSRCVAEFTGTFFLILTVALVCSDKSGPVKTFSTIGTVDSPATVIMSEASGPVLGVIGIASSLMVMVYSLGQVSGANFNPAVTLAMGMRSVLPWNDVAVYWLSQLSGAMVAVLMAVAIEADVTEGMVGGYNLALVGSMPSAGTGLPGVKVVGRGTWGQIFGAEFFFTFLLVFVVLNAAVSTAPNNYFGLAVGMCITVGGTAVGGISGGCFNPAVSFALGIGGLFAQNEGGGNAWFFIYWIAQLLAAAAAAGLTAFVRKEEDEDSEEEVSEQDERARFVN